MATMNSGGELLLEVIISGTRAGLGIRIVGGINTTSSDEFGIFVKEVIQGSLAARDGRLQRGDQLIKANGTNLVGVSNENAVSTLQVCAKTNTIKLVVSRSPTSRDEFRRLSSSILLQPAPPATQIRALSGPVATSTPREISEPPKSVRASAALSDGTVATNTRPSSASSNLTQVTTDLDSDDDIDKPMIQRRVVSSSSPEVALSDVMVSVHGRSMSDSSPPPLPNTDPPMFDEDSIMARQRQHSAEYHRATPEGRAVSPPLSDGLATHSFVIPKGGGLGIVIGGGINRQNGPHIFIEKILDGMAAAKDGQLRKGDRILSVNGILFNNMTRENALTTLTQLKIRPQIKAYTIAVDRPSGFEYTGLPTPTRNHNSIFDSDTLPVAINQSDSRVADTVDNSSLEVSTRGGRDESFRKAPPQRYLAKKGHAEGSRYDSLHKRMSMEPSARVKLNKLEWALNYMGHMMTGQQQEEMRERLDIGEDGRVVFADFVTLARELFAFQLDDARLEASLAYALTQKDSLELPSLPRKATSVDHLAMEYSPFPSQLKLAVSQPHMASPDTDELGAMRQQLHDIGQRRERLKLSDSGLSELRETDRQELVSRSPAPQQEYSEDGQTVLKRRAALAEAAAKASRDKANQLEDDMRRMAEELSELREQQVDRSDGETRGHLSALECELRKEKAVSRRFQVATDHLLQFVENCHEALLKSPDADRILYHPHGEGVSVARGDAVTGNPRPPQYLSRHAKITATSLAQEAKETVTAVQKLLQAETLPFGWDTVYTEDGHKYYVNHETKTTSWVHPVTKVNTSHGTRASTPSSQSSHRSNPRS